MKPFFEKIRKNPPCFPSNPRGNPPSAILFISTVAPAITPHTWSYEIASMAMHLILEFNCLSSPEPHLSRRLTRWAYSIPMLRRPSVVRRRRRQSSPVHPQIQTSSSPKPLGQSKPNFMWNLHRNGERKFVRGIWVTWPRWPSRPYMVKTLQKSSSPELVGRFPRNLVCSIRDSGPS